MEGGQSGTPCPCKFLPVTSTNVGISHKNSLTFSFKPFPTLLKNFRFITSASTKTTPPKSASSGHKIEIMIISLKEMLELPNFGHMTTSKIQFESRNKILLVTSWTKIIFALRHNLCLKIHFC